MKQITLNIKESHYTLFVQFLRSLTYVEIDKEETTAIQPMDQQPNEVQIMIDYALTSENDKPSYGNAAEKQRLESADSKKGLPETSKCIGNPNIILKRAFNDINL